MDKKDIKNFLKQTETRIKDLGQKAGELAKVLEKETSYGTKASMVRIEMLSLENEKNKLLSKMGEKAYELVRREEVKHKDLKEIFEEVKDIDNKITGKKISLTKMKKQHKKEK